MPPRTSSFDSKVVVSISLSDLPPARATLTTLLLLVDQAAGNGLGGDRMVTYSTLAEATAAQVASEISTATLNNITAVFSQRDGRGRPPSKVKVGRVDTGGSETYGDGYNACVAFDSDFYAVTIDSRANQPILDTSSAVETVGYNLFTLQSADADWLTTGGPPAALVALSARERSVITYHDGATEYLDSGWTQSRIIFDPDLQAAGWQGPINGVAGLITPLTTTQKDFALANNANLGLPFGSKAVFVAQGVNAVGRPVYELVTADWLRARVSEDLAELMIEHAARGEKLTVDREGQGKVGAIIAARLQQGEVVGHFVTGQTNITYPTITDADISAGIIRVEGAGQRTTDALTVDFSFQISTTTVNEAA